MMYSFPPTPFSLSFFAQVTTREVRPRMITFWKILWKYVNPLVMIIIFLGAMVKDLVNPLHYIAYQNVSPHTTLTSIAGDLLLQGFV